MPRIFAASQRLDVPITASTALRNRTTFSIMCWFKIASTATSNILYGESVTFNNTANISIGTDVAHKATAFLRTPTAFAQIDSSTSYDDGVWHRILFVRSGASAFQAWVDEVSIGTSAVSPGTSNVLTNGAAIGNWTAASVTEGSVSDQPFLGSIFRLVALTEAITAGEAERILYTGRTNRARIFHYELMGANPEPSVMGLVSGISLAQPITAGSTPGASSSLPPGAVLTDTYGIERGWIDWLGPGAVQKSRPSSDLSVGTWTTDTGGTTNLYLSINEISPLDTNYIQSVAAPSSAAEETALSVLVDPVTSNGHMVRLRGLIDQAVGGALTVLTELRQSSASLSTPASWTDTLTTTAQTFIHPLTDAQADAITDYTALSYLFTATQAASVTAPTWQAVGTAVSATTGTLTVTWPTHAINDIALLFVECQGGDTASLSTANGFAQVTNSPQTTGSVGTGSKLSVWWCRATTTSQAAPIMTAASDHQYGVIHTFRGCATSGNPWDVTSGGVKAVASTTTSTTGVTTTVSNCLIVEVVTKDLDSASAFASAETNAALTSVTERSDAGTTSGNGGGIAVWTGGKTAAGATGASSVTVTSSISTFMTISLTPIANASKAQITWTELEVPAPSSVVRVGPYAPLAGFPPPFVYRPVLDPIAVQRNL